MPDFEEIVLANVKELRDAIDDVRKSQRAIELGYNERMDRIRSECEQQLTALKDRLNEQYVKVSIEHASFKARVALLALVVGALPSLASFVYQIQSK